MNSNKITVILFCLLVLFTVISIIFYAKDNRHTAISDDGELFMVNVRQIPAVIRNYEQVKHIYGRKNSLIFRYVQTSCNSCNDRYLNALLAFQDEIGKDNVWVYSAYPTDRTSRIRLNTDLVKFNYMNVPRDSLLIPFHKGEEKSYFAWLNDSGEMDMVFFPDKDNVHLTRDFFIEVKEKMQQSPH